MREGATVGGLFGALISLLIELHIPSGEEILITGFAALDITKVSAQSFGAYFESLLLTLVIATLVGALGAAIGATAQTIITKH